MKKSLMLLVVVVLLGGVLAACGAKNNGGTAPNQENNGSKQGAGEKENEGSEQKAKKVALVLPEPVGVNPFFQQMDEGFKKAGEEFGVEVRTIESTDPASIEQNLRTAAAGDFDLIITATFQMEDALKKIAPEFSDKSFAIIDTVVDLPNVRSVVFREYEAAYVIGAAAALISESGTVGNVAAIEGSLLKKYTDGFAEGAKAINPDIKILVNYVGDFNDPAKAKELAILQSSQGADFIAGMSAVSDLGVFEAAKEKGFYTSGQDSDMTDGKQIIFSQLKGTDTIAYETVEDFVKGDFSYDVRDYGLKEGAVGIPHINYESTAPRGEVITEEILDKLKQINNDIVEGKIVVTNPLQ
ncbi:BMP family ABC transporter substrate-binding protein [Paenibacillaceae bacterium]|nr:BMP family ABC transporter substrate-binding protein [Paenibacillaceae bacterium]